MPGSLPTSATSEVRLRSLPTSAASEVRLRSLPTSAASEVRLRSLPTSAASEVRLGSLPTSATSTGDGILRLHDDAPPRATKCSLCAPARSRESWTESAASHPPPDRARHGLRDPSRPAAQSSAHGSQSKSARGSSGRLGCVGAAKSGVHRCGPIRSARSPATKLIQVWWGLHR